MVRGVFYIQTCESSVSIYIKNFEKFLKIHKGRGEDVH